MKWFYGSVALLFAIFTVDIAQAQIIEWCKQRKRVRDMKKWGLTPAFKGTKSHDWWLS